MDNTERIDRYLSGTMDAAEKQNFEAELENNAQLAEDLALQRDMAHFLSKRDSRSALKTQLNTIGSEYFLSQQAEPGKVVRMPLRRLLGIVAAAAAVVLLLVWQFWNGPSLYDTFAQHPPLALTEKSAGGTDWSITERAFKAQDYVSAEKQLLQYLELHPDDLQARLYLGICKMELNKTDEAKEIFLSFKDADASMRDFADWNLALNYLKAGQTASCREVLSRIEPTSSYFGSAKQLLNRLDK